MPKTTNSAKPARACIRCGCTDAKACEPNHYGAVHHFKRTVCSWLYEAIDPRIPVEVRRYFKPIRICTHCLTGQEIAQIEMLEVAFELAADARSQATFWARLFAEHFRP